MRILFYEILIINKNYQKKSRQSYNIISNDKQNSVSFQDLEQEWGIHGQARKLTDEWKAQAPPDNYQQAKDSTISYMLQVG